MIFVSNRLIPMPIFVLLALVATHSCLTCVSAQISLDNTAVSTDSRSQVDSGNSEGANPDGVQQQIGKRFPYIPVHEYEEHGVTTKLDRDYVPVHEYEEDGVTIKLDWDYVLYIVSTVFPLDGSIPDKSIIDVTNEAGKQRYKYLFKWYQQQPHLYVTQDMKNPTQILTLQAFIMYVSNDSERCIGIHLHSAVFDLLSFPFWGILQSPWPIFAMLHAASLQLRSTSGFPVENFCDSLDGEYSKEFRHALNVIEYGDSELNKDFYVQAEEEDWRRQSEEEEWRRKQETSRSKKTEKSFANNILNDEPTSEYDPVVGETELENAKLELHSLLRRIKKDKMNHRVSGLQIYRFLLKYDNPTKENYWHLGKCTFGKAAAAFALALMSDNRDEMSELVQEGQKYLYEYNHKDSLNDLLLSKWQPFRLLHVIHKRIWTEVRIQKLRGRIVELEEKIERQEELRGLASKEKIQTRDDDKERKEQEEFEMGQASERSMGSGRDKQIESVKTSRTPASRNVEKTPQILELDAQIEKMLGSSKTSQKQSDQPLASYPLTARIPMTRYTFPNSVFQGKPKYEFFPSDPDLKRDAVQVVVLRFPIAKKTREPAKPPAELEAIHRSIFSRHSTVIFLDGIDLLVRKGDDTMAYFLELLGNLERHIPVLILSDYSLYMTFPPGSSTGVAGPDNHVVTDTVFQDFLHSTIPTALSLLQKEDGLQIIGFPILDRVGHGDASDGDSSFVQQETSDFLPREDSDEATSDTGDDLYYKWEPRRIVQKGSMQKERTRRTSLNGIRTFQYVNYPTGYAKTKGKLCFEAEGGMSTSRLYRTGGLFKELFLDALDTMERISAAGSRTAIPSSEVWPNFMVAIDVAIKERGEAYRKSMVKTDSATSIRSGTLRNPYHQHLCFTRPVPERSYLQQANLPIAEAVYFAHDNQRLNCDSMGYGEKELYSRMTELLLVRQGAAPLTLDYSSGLKNTAYDVEEGTVLIQLRDENHIRNDQIGHDEKRRKSEEAKTTEQSRPPESEERLAFDFPVSTADIEKTKSLISDDSRYSDTNKVQKARSIFHTEVRDAVVQLGSASGESSYWCYQSAIEMLINMIVQMFPKSTLAIKSYSKRGTSNLQDFYLHSNLVKIYIPASSVVVPKITVRIGSVKRLQIVKTESKIFWTRLKDTAPLLDLFGHQFLSADTTTSPSGRVFTPMNENYRPANSRKEFLTSHPYRDFTIEYVVCGVGKTATTGGGGVGGGTGGGSGASDGTSISSEEQQRIQAMAERYTYEHLERKRFMMTIIPNSDTGVGCESGLPGLQIGTDFVSLIIAPLMHTKWDLDEIDRNVRRSIEKWKERELYEKELYGKKLDGKDELHHRELYSQKEEESFNKVSSFESTRESFNKVAFFESTRPDCFPDMRAREIGKWDTDTAFGRQPEPAETFPKECGAGIETVTGELSSYYEAHDTKANHAGESLSQAGNLSQTGESNASNSFGGNANLDNYRSWPVLFFPIVDESGKLHDTCYNLKLAYWKGMYYKGGSSMDTYASASDSSTDNSFADACHTGSAFRIYAQTIFMSVVRNLYSISERRKKERDWERDELKRSDPVENVLPYLDFILHQILLDNKEDRRQNSSIPTVQVAYLNSYAIPEKRHYLQNLRLQRNLADESQVESVVVLEDAVVKSRKDSNLISISTPITHKSDFCMVGLNWFQINARGVVGSYCFRLQLEKHFKTFLDWGVDELGLQAIPEEGTLLAIFRNGEVSQFPWDSDSDLKLYSEKRYISPLHWSLRDVRIELKDERLKDAGLPNLFILKRESQQFTIRDRYGLRELNLEKNGEAERGALQNALETHGAAAVDMSDVVSTPKHVIKVTLPESHFHAFGVREGYEKVLSNKNSLLNSSDLLQKMQIPYTSHIFHAQIKQMLLENQYRPNGLTNFTQAWSFDGCSSDQYFLVRVPNITHHICDIYYSAGKPKSLYPWKVRLMSSKVGATRASPMKQIPSSGSLGKSPNEKPPKPTDLIGGRKPIKRNKMRYVSTSQDQMEHIFFDRYHGPTEKFFGDHGSILQCWTHHSACLPQCAADTGKGQNAMIEDGSCEFPDNFVHVDVWELPETDELYWPNLF